MPSSGRSPAPVWLPGWVIYLLIKCSNVMQACSVDCFCALVNSRIAQLLIVFVFNAKQRSTAA